MLKRAISADSHITEPPNIYTDYVDPAFRSRAPRLVTGGPTGDFYVIDGMPHRIPMGLIAAAGKNAIQLSVEGRWERDEYRGGWDPEVRMADQDRDGIAAEVIYPSVGMLLCNHPDPDYKKSCFDAYNRWLEEYCGAHPDRLLGLGQTAMRSVEEGIEDLRKIKEYGFRGVMLPGFPVVNDYDHAVYDPFYEAAVDLNLPLSFHILTTGSPFAGAPRGPKIATFMSIIRGVQDVLATMVFGGVFERHPKLKVVCAEADAGWAPHFMYRMDHAYRVQRYALNAPELSRMPSEYFGENVYLTFQDDWVAFKVRNLGNINRLLWANDYPHSDSTWPGSQQLLREHSEGMTDGELNLIVHDNAAALYGVN
jgi:uncharacterized protein